MSFYPKHDLNLLTDFYQLTMAYAYWKLGMAEKESVFHLFFRKKTFFGGFTVAAGLNTVIDYLKDFRYQESDLEYLQSLKTKKGEALFSLEFLDYLKNLCFSCSLAAAEEGTVVFPYEPLIRIQGPLLQCQILESTLLNFINFPSLIATKAARICLAADGDEVLEFGLRRAPGASGALLASRAAYLGGCQATSNVLAGKLFDIPIRGTHAHSWVMCFDDEKKAFDAYLQVLPENAILLVDTYDTLSGIKKAIEVAKSLKEKGGQLLGLRLDSGDLSSLSKKARQMLDAEGLQEVMIVASNELDEFAIARLKKEKAPISIWGVGTNLVTGRPQAALDGVYKLSALRQDNSNKWDYKLKLSEERAKISMPGILQVRRFQSHGQHQADLIYDTTFGLSEEKISYELSSQKKIASKNFESSQDLLQPIFQKGRLIYKQKTLSEQRTSLKQELNNFSSEILRLKDPSNYLVAIDKNLYDIKNNIVKIKSENLR